MGAEQPSDGGASGPDQARFSVAQRTNERKRREREEQRVQELNKDAYVRSSGNVVRSLSSGRAVIAGRSGQQAVEQSRQEQVLEQYGSQEGARNAAIRQLEQRAKSTIPGMLGAVQRASINRQLEQLRSGATAQFSLSQSGNFVTTGVTPAGQGGGTTPNIRSLAQDSASDDRGGVVARNLALEAEARKSPISDAARRGLLSRSAEKTAAQRYFLGR